VFKRRPERIKWLDLNIDKENRLQKDQKKEKKNNQSKNNREFKITVNR